jgi:hypothetical protein
MKKLIIHGCEARGDGDQPYLTRWILCKFQKWAIYFHKFHRSDADDLHDHPWSFISIILWRGYNEVTFGASKDERVSRRIYPGQIIFRKATHTHRVVLRGNKPAYTLVIRFKYTRYWGFYIGKHWQDFREYFKNQGC